MAQTKPAKKEAVTYPIPMKKQKAERGNKVYDVADIYDVARIYRPEANPAQCFFVISKQEFRLYVYEVEGKDTLLAAHFPICYAKNPGPKMRTGDMSTPECSLQRPATISQIRNSSSWAHDFKDGRGSFPAYGAWFMRLDFRNNQTACPGFGAASICICTCGKGLVLQRRFYFVGMYQSELGKGNAMQRFFCADGCLSALGRACRRGAHRRKRGPVQPEPCRRWNTSRQSGASGCISGDSARKPQRGSSARGAGRHRTGSFRDMGKLFQPHSYAGRSAYYRRRGQKCTVAGDFCRNIRN